MVIYLLYTKKNLPKTFFRKLQKPLFLYISFFVWSQKIALENYFYLL